MAAVVAPLVQALLGSDVAVPFEFWDGSRLGPAEGPAAVRVQSAKALRHLMWAPGELGFARAFVGGDIELDGDVFELLRKLSPAVTSRQRLTPHARAAAVAAARALGALGPPLRPPAVEVRPHGTRHSKRRDTRSVRHHYDLGNEFHRLVLGPSMTYSCAYFPSDGGSLEDAQASKHELVCRKLGLDQAPGRRLLDVGCGWGSMAIHAARYYEADVVGITLSESQAALARARVIGAGLAGKVEIRVQDYRDLRDGPFDVICSIGMFEHVGRANTDLYFDGLRGLLAPGGRLLNHAIATAGGSQLKRRSFMYRYVFPDGELQDVGSTILAMERAGFEVRHVESLREHYRRTLHLWFENLVRNWDAAVEAAGLERTRVWWVYLAGCANAFEDGGLNVYQVLGAV